MYACHWITCVESYISLVYNSYFSEHSRVLSVNYRLHSTAGSTLQKTMFQFSEVRTLMTIVRKLYLKWFMIVNFDSHWKNGLMNESGNYKTNQPSKSKLISLARYVEQRFWIILSYVMLWIPRYTCSDFELRECPAPVRLCTRLSGWYGCNIYIILAVCIPFHFCSSPNFLSTIFLTGYDRLGNKIVKFCAIVNLFCWLNRPVKDTCFCLVSQSRKVQLGIDSGKNFIIWCIIRNKSKKREGGWRSPQINGIFIQA